MGFSKASRKWKCSTLAAAFMFIMAHGAIADEQGAISIESDDVWTISIIIVISLILLLSCTLFEIVHAWLLKKSKRWTRS